jgi:hypothetical protein
MTDKPPDDPAEHATRFAEEWADVAESYTQGRMRELGNPDFQVGTTDIQRGGGRRAFIPYQVDGGGCDPAGRLNVDSGALNPDPNAAGFGPSASAAWAKARIRDRIDAIIAHEYEESRGRTHSDAESQATDTALPISPAARALLRTIARRESEPNR